MIALVYFVEKLAGDRKHHEVNDGMLKAWAWHYRRSGTTLRPCLLMDRTTEPPAWWEYDAVRLADCDPPQRRDVLNKVGWMKAQAYTELGPCLLMDIDNLILTDIDHLADRAVPMAMPTDPARRVYADWPEVGEELNAGLMWLNSPAILPEFRRWWDAKLDPYFSLKTYYDELIFSAVCRQMGGVELPEDYNGSWEVGDDAGMFAVARRAKVLHFHGHRKAQLETYLKKAVF